MLWEMDLYYWPDMEMVPDYWYSLGIDLCFDEMSCAYLNYTTNLRNLYPPITGTMIPENIHGYYRPTIRSCLVNQTVSLIKLACLYNTDVDLAVSPLLTVITLDTSGVHHFCIQTVPILTGLISPADIDRSTKPMHQSYIIVLSAKLLLYLFVIYGLILTTSSHLHSLSLCLLN